MLDLLADPLPGRAGIEMPRRLRQAEAAGGHQEHDGPPVGVERDQPWSLRAWSFHSDVAVRGGRASIGHSLRRNGIEDSGFKIHELHANRDKPGRPGVDAPRSPLPEPTNTDPES